MPVCLYVLHMSDCIWVRKTSSNNTDGNQGTNTAIFLHKLALFLACYFCSPRMTKLPTLVTQPGVWSMPCRTHRWICWVQHAGQQEGPWVFLHSLMVACLTNLMFQSRLNSKGLKSKNHKSGSANCKSEKCQSKKLFKSANLRICNFAQLTCGPPTFAAVQD